MSDNVKSDNVKSDDISVGDKLKLKEKIEGLNINQQKEIFNIIQKESSSFSTNSNGVFFDLLTFNNELIQKIIKQISYYDETNKEETERKKIMDEYKEEFTSQID